MSATRICKTERDEIEKRAHSILYRIHHMVHIPKGFDDNSVMDTLWNMLPYDVREFAGATEEFVRNHELNHSGLVRTLSDEKFSIDCPMTDRSGEVRELRVRFEVEGTHIMDWYARKDTIIHWPRGRYYVSKANPMYDELCKWANDYHKYSSIFTNAYNMFQRFNLYCNTPGQWLRVLPEIVVAMDHQHQVAIKNLTKSSAVPKGLTSEDLTNARVLGKMLATCAVLPEYKVSERPLAIHDITNIE